MRILLYLICINTILLYITNPAYSKSKYFCKDAKKEVCLISHKKPLSRYDLIAINNTPHIVSFHLDIKTNNILSTKTLPIEFKLKGRTKYKVTQLKVKNLKKESSFNVVYSWMYGDMTATQNNFIYRLPYKLKTSHTVGQGFNTNHSHTGLNKYAIDWNMPTGTPIYAARSGHVIELKDDSNHTGTTEESLNMANYIKILHKDGSFAVYAHLKQNGIVVKKGQYASQGSLIGYSGNTGYSTGPHLHFHVAKPYPYENKMIELTIPSQFKNCKNPKPFIPQAGQKYQSC